MPTAATRRHDSTPHETMAKHKRAKSRRRARKVQRAKIKNGDGSAGAIKYKS